MMTDNEIIKALECCGDEGEITLCSICPYYLQDRYSDFCQEDLHRASLDLINRQKAEVEEYKEANKRWSDALNNANEENTELQHRINELQHEISSCNSEILNKYKARIQVEEMVVCADSLGEWLEFLDEFKAEAIKEFAERLCEGRISNDPVVIAVKCELKEKVGDNDED